MACYGRLRPDTDTVWLRFLTGRSVSARTTPFLAWCAERLAAAGKTALRRGWDNASGHRSPHVRDWLRTPNRRGEASGAARARRRPRAHG